MISRAVAYHGTPHGALSITGIPAAKAVFEPLVPAASRCRHGFYRARNICATMRYAFGQWAANRIAEMIEFEGPETVPQSSSSRCRTPAAASRRRRDTSSASARSATSTTSCWSPTRPSAPSDGSGSMFRLQRLRLRAHHHHCAKGMSSGYSPIGAMLASERLFEPFKQGTNSFATATLRRAPVSAAVAMANLDLMESEGLNDRVHELAPAFKAELDTLLDLPIVGDVRGAGYFYGIELVKDKTTRETFNEDESERLLRGFLSKALFDTGLYCRADDRGDPVVQLAPPLTIGQAEFSEITGILRSVLTKPGTCSEQGLQFDLTTVRSLWAGRRAVSATDLQRSARTGRHTESMQSATTIVRADTGSGEIAPAPQRRGHRAGGQRRVRHGLRRVASGSHWPTRSDRTPAECWSAASDSVTPPLVC